MNTFNCSWPCGQNSNLITHRYSFCNIIVTETIYFTHTIKNLLLYDIQLKTIGDKIQYYRKLNKLTQSDLAKILSIHVCTIIRYENNTHMPSDKIKKMLEKALGYSL
ncbi:helix-turn-helix domain-containing protein [Zhenhengia yiwuensis]